MASTKNSRDESLSGDTNVLSEGPVIASEVSSNNPKGEPKSGGAVLQHEEIVIGLEAPDSASGFEMSEENIYHISRSLATDPTNITNPTVSAETNPETGADRLVRNNQDNIDSIVGSAIPNPTSISGLSGNTVILSDESLTGIEDPDSLYESRNGEANINKIARSTAPSPTNTAYLNQLHISEGPGDQLIGVVFPLMVNLWIKPDQRVNELLKESDKYYARNPAVTHRRTGRVSSIHIIQVGRSSSCSQIMDAITASFKEIEHPADSMQYRFAGTPNVERHQRYWEIRPDFLRVEWNVLETDHGLTVVELEDDSQLSRVLGMIEARGWTDVLQVHFEFVVEDSGGEN